MSSISEKLISTKWMRPFYGGEMIVTVKKNMKTTKLWTGTFSNKVRVALCFLGGKR